MHKSMTVTAAVKILSLPYHHAFSRLGFRCEINSFAATLYLGLAAITIVGGEGVYILKCNQKGPNPTKYLASVTDTTTYLIDFSLNLVLVGSNLNFTRPLVAPYK